MNFNFSDCNGIFEHLYVIFLIFSIFLYFVVYTFALRNEVRDKVSYLYEVLSFFMVLFTEEYLTDKGKFYRKLLLGIFWFLIMLILVGLILKPC